MAEMVVQVKEISGNGKDSNIEIAVVIGDENGRVGFKEWIWYREAEFLIRYVIEGVDNAYANALRAFVQSIEQSENLGDLLLSIYESDWSQSPEWEIRQGGTVMDAKVVDLEQGRTKESGKIKYFVECSFCCGLTCYKYHFSSSMSYKRAKFLMDYVLPNADISYKSMLKSFIACESNADFASLIGSNFESWCDVKVKENVNWCETWRD